MRQEINMAIDVRRTEEKPLHCKAAELQKDILNISSHIFCKHKRCKAHGLKCIKYDNVEKNYVPLLTLKHVSGSERPHIQL